jgi:hypothetical protein
LNFDILPFDISDLGEKIAAPFLSPFTDRLALMAKSAEMYSAIILAKNFPA